MALFDTPGRTYETLGLFKQKEGRRHVQQQITIAPLDSIQPKQTGTFNFLKGGQGPEALLAFPSERTTKYHTGFQRRPYDNIRPEDSRLAMEDEKAMKFYERAPVRSEYLERNMCRYGNVVNSSDGTPCLPQNRKHYDPLANQPEMRRRQMDSGARFYAMDEETHTSRRLQRMEFLQNRQIQKSSIIGVGRKDIASIGVWDNFMSPPAVLQGTDKLTAKVDPRPF